MLDNWTVCKQMTDVWLVARDKCYIARYTDVWNRHRESEIHDIHEIGSDTKLYDLWVKGYLI